MSTYAANEFIVSSNNSMNDNTYNSQKATKTHRIKAILKPLLRMLRKTSAEKKRNASFDSDYHSRDHCAECSDNSANEDLETSIMDEIDNCQPDAAIFVADEDGQWNLSPVTRGTCVPVHFARTEAGTFFWTSMRPDCDVSPAFHCYTECQQAAQQQPILAHDRWVQA